MIYQNRLEKKTNLIDSQNGKTFIIKSTRR